MDSPSAPEPRHGIQDCLGYKRRGPFHFRDQHDRIGGARVGLLGVGCGSSGCVDCDRHRVMVDVPVDTEPTEAIGGNGIRGQIRDQRLLPLRVQLCHAQH